MNELAKHFNYVYRIMYINDILIPGVYGSYVLYTYDSKRLAIFMLGHTLYD